MPKMERTAFENFVGNANKKKRSGYYKTPAPNKVGDTYTYRARIMPPKKGSSPLLDFNEHYYQSPITGEWVRGLCPKDYNEKCPLSEQNRPMWNKAKTENNKKMMDMIKKFFEKQGSLVCLYIKEDPANPANNGTLQVMSAGMKLRAKMLDGFANQDIGEAGCDTSPQGLDFLIKVTRQKGGEAGKEAEVNYDLSEFARKPTPIQAVNDKRTEDEIWKEVPDDLSAHLPRRYSYSEWVDIVEKTINTGAPSETAKSSSSMESPFDAKKPEEKAPEKVPEKKIDDKPAVNSDTNVEGDELMAELNKLKNDVEAGGDEIPF